MRRRRPPVLIVHETAIAAAVLEHWLTLGVPGSLVACIPNAFAHGQAGLTRGLPDLIVMSPQLGNVVGFIELKTERGRRSDAQIAIGDFLMHRRIPYAVTYGREEPIRVLEQWGAVKPQAPPANIKAAA